MTEAAATAPSPSPAEIQADTLAALRQALGDDAIRVSEFRDNLRVHVESPRLLQTLAALRERGFGVLVDLGAADYLNYPGRPGGSPRFEVHYVLLNPDTIRRIVVKVGVGEAEPILPSITQFWTGADWMEREVFDMFGIQFDGHPDLRRILMPDEFTAHPLRKDYPLRGRGERHNFPRLTRGES